jgi:predicted transcriptional regulator
MTFQKMCARLAAIRCREAGQSVKEIAISAGKSETTIRRWLKLRPF